MSTKKTKTQPSWILPGLFTILMAIATTYCLLQYRSSVLIVGISTLLLLASAYWLFLSITRIIKSKEAPAPSVGEEQRERMNYEGMKLQGEELIRLVNMFGKGTYVNTKRTTERLDLLLEQSNQLQKANELLVQRLIEEQTRNAKFQVKYAQNDTGKLIAALNQQCNNLDAAIATCSAAIAQIRISAPAASAPVVTQTMDTQAITDSLNELSSELANINASIQELQQSLATAGIQAAVQPVMDEHDDTDLSDLLNALTATEVASEETDSDVSASIEEDVLSETNTPIEEDILNDSGVPMEEIILNETDTPITENTPNEPAAPIEEDILNEAGAPIEEDVLNEAGVPIEEDILNEAGAPIAEDILPEASATEAPAPETTSDAAAPDVSSLLSDDPNKQLSADEIAALFAALG